MEHGITEEVVGIDLVEWMIKEAADELKDIDRDYSMNGNAIEVRVYAEDCINNFRPSSGKIDDVCLSCKARVETWIRKILKFPHCMILCLQN